MLIHPFDLHENGPKIGKNWGVGDDKSTVFYAITFANQNNEQRKKSARFPRCLIWDWVRTLSNNQPDRPYKGDVRNRSSLFPLIEIVQKKKTSTNYSM